VIASTDHGTFQHDAQVPAVLAAIFPFGTFLLFPSGKKRRRSLLILVFLMGGALGMGGCVGTASTAAVSNTVKNSQTVTFTTTAGGSVVSTPVTITIN
jgi:hypothetical protein